MKKQENFDKKSNKWISNILVKSKKPKQVYFDYIRLTVIGNLNSN